MPGGLPKEVQTRESHLLRANWKRTPAWSTETHVSLLLILYTNELKLFNKRNMIFISFISQIGFQVQQPYTGLDTNQIEVEVGDLCDDDECVRYEETITVAELRYVKRLTMPQAAEVALLFLGREEEVQNAKDLLGNHEDNRVDVQIPLSPQSDFEAPEERFE